MYPVCNIFPELAPVLSLNTLVLTIQYPLKLSIALLSYKDQNSKIRFLMENTRYTGYTTFEYW